MSRRHERAGRPSQCDSGVGVHADILSIPDCSPRRTARACAPPARARIQTHPDADGRGRRRRPLEFFLTRASILYWNPVLIQDVPDFPEIRHHPTYGRCTCDHLCTPTPESHCDGPGPRAAAPGVSMRRLRLQQCPDCAGVARGLVLGVQNLAMP